MYKRRRPGFKLRSALLFFALLCLAGCAGFTVDPGPDPARITLQLQAAVSREQIKATMRDNWLDNPAVLPGWFHRVEGPFWQWGLYLEAADGTLNRLPNRQGLNLVMLRADRLDQTVTFLAPPRAGVLVLLVEPYLVHYFYERDSLYGGQSSESYSIATFRENLRLKLCPGCNLKLKKVIKAKDWPKQGPKGLDGKI